MKKLLTASLVAALAGSSLLLLAGPGFAADLGSEVNNAQTHAGLAAKAGDIKGVHMHLHHALNCLVGPSGDGFDAKQMNPCANSGSGAITDSSNAGQKAKLEMAVNQAKAGIAANDMAAAVKDATDAQATIASAK